MINADDLRAMFGMFDITHREVISVAQANAVGPAPEGDAPVSLVFLAPSVGHPVLSKGMHIGVDGICKCVFEQSAECNVSLMLYLVQCQALKTVLGPDADITSESLWGSETKMMKKDVSANGKIHPAHVCSHGRANTASIFPTNASLTRPHNCDTGLCEIHGQSFAGSRPNEMSLPMALHAVLDRSIGVQMRYLPPNALDIIPP